ncbi:alpha/beta hydrolase [Rhodococcus sp. BP-149]|uniref:esterase/lipase family protein n=1 Tax=unclassified Rhodococcus (in: high G+C Gram-positive bacteria) TaxID=192944 RepID=UPI001C9B6CA9|nr:MULTISPECIES: alpha/beta fold hydrolase [unclassified Rhodococcus (in: high G+C Gram-positive bacteria)]MBY6684132.1 alpha/beta hydrolase [Rhodococcus sp. BP-288]MBY6693207.1 alpha/beta hydrolase [Rhodococcus sp. BP-188]MBY6697404.1 alpha/beta hydrolase [Rhodococcus sp. BP-285]MBY6702081.1 alpha/beta hydrolase [Rhodococcus sp. BP-283]MBY6709986.1 alpha/beta hydrolase [Rhodococcus sp. BP-160]
MHSNRDRNEVAGAADVVATAIDILSRPVQGTHRAINDVVFGVLGRSAAPVRILNEGIADLVYEAVRGGGVAAAEAVTAVSRLLPEDRVSHAVTSTAAGSVVVGAVNGLLGDRLAAEGNDLTVELGPHHERRIVGNDTAMLTTAYPKATGHVAVLVHGLGETEQAWYYRHDGRGSYGEALAAHGISAVCLRYNTGAGIEDNGAALAGLLDELIAVWPVPVERIDLVGHSMGGLVVRRACAVEASRATWLPLVRTACYLGTPHEGAPLATGVYHLSRALRKVRQTAVWADLLDVRSRGVDDLRLATDVALAPGMRHVAVAATLAADDTAWWADAVGDGLVTLRSARGPMTELHTLVGTGHLALLSDPRVLDVLTELMADATPAEIDDVTEPDETVA